MTAVSKFRSCLPLLAAAACGSALAQSTDFSDVEITAHHVAGSVHYLEGRGGNIGLSIGADGIVMIDDQFAPLTDRIVAAIEMLTDGEIRFLINTHVHPDHTGGNENFGGMGVPIMAHDNVRVRMTRGIRGEAPSPVAARPILTYANSVHVSLNGEDIDIVKLPDAHTDGDSLIYFRTSNVIHMGDVFRTSAYPVIDTENGGTAAGTIEALRMAIEIAGPQTVILPGHGVLSTEADMQAFLDMLIDVEDRVSKMIDDGMTLEQVIAAAPTADYDADYGAPERFLTGLYTSLESGT
jgi:cyclase